MHDGSIAQGDAWLKKNIDGYAQWAMTHSSLLIVTFDEDDASENNRIATIVMGQKVGLRKYAQRMDHYGLLRMIEEIYGLPLLGESAKAKSIPGSRQGRSK
jgi:acid phosphatase